MKCRNFRYTNPDFCLPLSHVSDNPVRYLGVHMPVRDPISAAEMQEISARLAEDCSRLPDKESQVIALRYGPAGLTQVETAQVLGISRRTVQRFEHQGLAHLSEDLILRRAYGAN